MKEFRRLDLNAVEAGTSIPTLMAHAGKALAEAARARGDSVVLLCGKGNNGGDGFSAAGLLLRWGVETDVVLLLDRDDIQGPARRYLDLLPEEHVHEWGPDRRRWKTADVVVDCMLGSGLHGALRKPIDQAVRWFNKHPGHKIACDVPTGLGSRLQAQPDVTVTFHAAKEGMEGRSGEIQVVDIGIPPEAADIGIGDLDAGFVKQRPAGHKGDHGRVLVIGGGPFDGAPHYAGMGAVRAGADLVYAVAPEPTATAMRHWGPDLLVRSAGTGRLTWPLALPQADAIVIGPGMGAHPESLAVVKKVLAATEVPVVVDADGLRALDKATLATFGHRMVLTPHAAEFKRLAGHEPSEARVTALAKQHGLVILAKGPTDIVSDGTTTRRCKRGHPAMTKGGTGDVLAGVVAALLTRGADRFDAACAAAYLVGRAGEVAAAVRGPGMSATDLHETLPSILSGL